MAILWMDNFNIYGTDANNRLRMLDGVYASIKGSGFGDCFLVADPDASATGLVCKIDAGFGGGGNYNGIRKVLPANTLTCGVALRMHLAALPQAADQIPTPIAFKNASNGFLYCLCVTTTGRLEVRAGAPDGALVAGAATVNPVVTANAWYHIEMKLFCNAAAGTVEVRVEGVTVITVAGLNTGAVPVSQVEIDNDPSGTSVSPTMYAKDFIVWDATTGFNNNFMGSCQVLKLIPDGDVALNWTPNPADGVGYDKINEVTPDDDTRYISAPYPEIPAAYKCSLSDLPVTVTSVRGVMPIHRSRKTDGGDGNIQAGLISGAVIGLGSDRPITTAYTYWWDIFDANPDGAVAWTRPAVNALNMQLNRTL